MSHENGFRAHNDWSTTRAWRRMFLALVDLNTTQAREALSAAAVAFAGLAVTHAQNHDADEFLDAARGGNTAAAFRVFSITTEVLAGVCPRADIDAELCGFLRASCPHAPPGFSSTGTYGRTTAGPFVPTRHAVAN